MMSVLCHVGVYERSMCMSGRHVCEINVYVNILITRANGCGDCFSQLRTGKKCRYMIWASYHFDLSIIKPWSFV